MMTIQEVMALLPSKPFATVAECEAFYEHAKGTEWWSKYMMGTRNFIYAMPPFTVYDLDKLDEDKRHIFVQCVRFIMIVYTPYLVEFNNEFTKIRRMNEKFSSSFSIE